VVIGGGIAGMETAACLAEKGVKVTLFEKNEKVGGNVANWHSLFPTIRQSTEIIQHLEKRLKDSSVTVITNTLVSNISKEGSMITVKGGDARLSTDAVVLASGFQIFDSKRKEEFGYGIYDNVITSSDLEAMMKKDQPITTKSGKPINRVAFIHCVGSRDEKVGNHYCSKICCVTGVKQAIVLRSKIPQTEIFCFYIDLRMYGAGFEELYREAQEKHGVQFVRGRLSEAAENIDGTLQIKAEDTLSGRPLKMKIDLMVLLAGMEPSDGTKSLGKNIGLTQRMGAFIKPADEHFSQNKCSMEGMFLSGTCSGPMSINETLSDARSAAQIVEQYLMNK